MEIEVVESRAEMLFENLQSEYEFRLTKGFFIYVLGRLISRSIRLNVYCLFCQAILIFGPSSGQAGRSIYISLKHIYYII